MKILKYLLFLLLLIVIGSAIYFGTKDGAYDLQDSIVIPTAPEVVFEKVNDFKSWESWTSAKKEDPNMVFNFAEKTSGEGATFSWKGTKSGSVKTTKVIPNNEIHQEFTFESPLGKRNAEMQWNFEKMGDSTKVTWHIKGEHTLVDKIFQSLRGTDFDATIHKRKKEELDNISDEIVSDLKRYTINVDGITEYGGGYYMYTTSVAKTNEMVTKSMAMMEHVKKFVSRHNLNRSGHPFTIYNEKDAANNTVIFSTCVPVKEKVITPEGSSIVCGFMEPVYTVKTTLKGDYINLPEALQKGMEYIAAEGMQLDLNRKIFEVYGTDITEEPNPSKWVTEIYIPIVSSEESL